MTTFHASLILESALNPILHTVWLGNHALTLKNVTAKNILVKMHTFQLFVQNPGNFASNSNKFSYSAITGCLKANPCASVR
jgi:hypothetical protein